MWRLFPLTAKKLADPTMLVVDDHGFPCCLARDHAELIAWLYEQGLEEIGLDLAGETIAFPIVYPDRRERSAQGADLANWLLRADPHPKWVDWKAMLRSETRTRH